MQSDPIGLDGGINTYGYVGSSPLRYTDKRGLAKWDVSWDLACGGKVVVAGCWGNAKVCTKCEAGQRTCYYVALNGLGLGVGLPVSYASGTAELNDYLSGPPNINELIGNFHYESVSAGVGGVNYGFSSLSLGYASSTTMNTEFEAGAGSIIINNDDGVDLIKLAPERTEECSCEE